MNREIKRLLLGLGFDCKDGHKRVTIGKNFCLYGGSSQTHQFMQEKAIKFNEELKHRHKTLEEINKKEFCEILDKIDLSVASEDET